MGKRKYPFFFVARGYGKGKYAVYEQNSARYGDIRQVSHDTSQLGAYRIALALTNGELEPPEVGRTPGPVEEGQEL